MAEEECMEAELWTGPLNSARTWEDKKLLGLEILRF
jgi:hypothetical protein